MRWHADRMAENADQRQRRNDPAYLAEKREERRLRYLSSKRNGVLRITVRGKKNSVLCVRELRTARKLVV